MYRYINDRQLDFNNMRTAW